MPKTKEKLPAPPPDITKLRNAVRFFYDLQKLRIQGGNRGRKEMETTQLDEHDKSFMEKTSTGLKALERETLKEVTLHLKRHPISAWLLDQKGIGPTMAGVIVSEVDIHKAPTVSSLWKYSGLAVDTTTGKADGHRRGQRSRFNPFLKTKMLKVLGDSFIKCNSPWRKFYDDYKHRKTSTMVPVCMACDGTGISKWEDDAAGDDENRDVEASRSIRENRDAEASHERTDDRRSKASRENEETRGPKASRGEREIQDALASRADTETRTSGASRQKPCQNCSGTGGPAPWGKSDMHRHQAAVRYMIKMLLMQLWERWRTLEGLEVRAPYANEYLGREHHEQASP